MLRLPDVIMILRDIFNADSTLEKSRTNPTYFTRKRKLPFAAVLEVMLCMYHKSTQKILNKFFGRVFCSQQSFSEARQKFTEYPFVRALECLRNAFYSSGNRETLKTFHGYHIFAIDGSAFALPGLKSLLDIFGGTGKKADSPTARASIIYDVMSKFILHADIKPLKVDERTLAKVHISAIQDIICLKKCIILMDRGYPSEALIRDLLGKTYFVMRVKTSFSKKIDVLPCGDHIIELYPNISVRILKFALKSGETETLISNVNDINFDEFKRLYFMRWEVEITFDLIKNKIETTNWGGWSEQCIRQEFFLGILLTNVVLICEREAAVKVDERRNPRNKYEYRPNMSNIVSTLQGTLSKAVFAIPKKEIISFCRCIIEECAYQPCPVRPRRSFSRNKEPRKTKFHKSRKSAL